ncbi:chloride channel protein [Acidihalobacter prosperus]|uniref:Chloride channel protein n=1 Tax=Acidihalobacter prosperus TaxID=160660 RepID=A0A1A6C0S3_9GAMM|nr:chloride channel protein [Acidihalobacter prosperus]OBS08149.1 chloride channel protein [Acidihalobacter prosperus]
MSSAPPGSSSLPPATGTPRQPGVRPTLALLALLVGIIAGIGAAVFRGLIGLFHNLFFFGHFAIEYDTLKHTLESPWGIGVVAVPVIGALLVAFLVQTFAPEAKGHGVPEVIDAIYYKRGVIRPQVALIKSLASSISIGSGGAIGREGPIIQIGATFGSVLAQWTRLPEWQRLVLIACGAGGGIAATFNTPIGGILFATEIMLVEISARTLIPVMIATGAASFVGRLFFGNHASFIIPPMTLHAATSSSFRVFLAYAMLGLVMGLLGMLYTRSVYAFEDFFDRIPGNYYTRHALGMLIVGVMMYLLMRHLGHYYIEGVGYATIQDILDGHLTVTWILLALVLLKLVAVSLTLGSGASGGIFSPALFMGATLGAGLVNLGHGFLPGLEVSPVGGAVIGMACMVAAGTGAAVTAVVMIFEMTRDYNVIIPLIIAVSLAYAVRHLLIADDLYTLKLSRRGRRLPRAVESNLYLMRGALELIQAPFLRLDADAHLGALRERLTSRRTLPHVVLVRDGQPTGIITSDVLATALAADDDQTALGRYADPHYTLLNEHTQIIDLVSRLRGAGTRIAVLAPGDPPTTAADAVVGIVSWDDVMEHANLPGDLRGAAPS